VSQPSVVPFLKALSDLYGSDLHCKVGSPPRVRIDGKLRRLQVPPLTAGDTEAMVSEVLRDDLREEFARTNEADFAYSVPGLGRFRVNAFRARGAAGLVFRRVPSRWASSGCRRRSARWPWSRAGWCSSPGRRAPASRRRSPAWSTS
jgi:Tfp pilus assembly pilus retraction ATPase PilT